MTTTTYYNLNIVEGTDIVNPLTVDNPNYQKIDETMHDNAVAGVTLATELTNATIHALTRENSECSVIRFIATSKWKAGDSVTVDGVPVLALLPSGETLPDGAYVINANVLCVLTGTNLTVYVSKSSANASDITYNDTNVGEALNSLNDSMATVTSNLSTVSNNLSTVTTDLTETNNNLTVLDERVSATKYDSVDAVDLNTYTDAINVYTFPADGYVTIASISGGVGEVTIVSSNDVALVTFSNIGSQNYWTANTVYVKKGMKCYCTARAGAFGTNVNVSFRPLK